MRYAAALNSRDADTVVSNGPNIPPGSKPPTIHAMGRSEDELVKQDGRWLFSQRVVLTDMNTQWEP